MNTEKVRKKGMIVRFKPLFITISMWVLILAGHTTCFAETVLLQWDADTDPSVVGYKVYYQADSSTQPYLGTGATQGASPIDVRNQTSAIISNLDPGHAYFFAVTSYNAVGVESPYSNVASIIETVPPTTSLTFPANSAAVSGTVSVVATATDNVAVTKVEFFVNGTLKATATTSPYTFRWDTTLAANGSCTLTVKAYDAAGNVGQSAAITVTVNNTGALMPVKGDVDGDGAFTVKDAIIVLQAVTNPALQTETLKAAGDVAPLDSSGKSAGDGKLTIADALLILRRVIGAVTW